MLNRQRAVHKPETIDDEEKIAICKFAKDFVPDEGNAEMTMDGKKLINYYLFISLYIKSRIF